MGLASAWYMTGATDSWLLAYTPRIADQIQFLTELQRAFYQEIWDYYRNTLSCQSLIAFSRGDRAAGSWARRFLSSPWA
jgi:hypothetical protein